MLQNYPSELEKRKNYKIIITKAIEAQQASTSEDT
jgi:hypothetical protein